MLEPIFRYASPEHHIHVAHFIAEVLGGPKSYSEEDGGSHAGMIQKHHLKHLTEQNRKQWVKLLLETADDVALPDDPEFRSAFIAYIEWGTRIAVITSNADALNMPPDEPMPVWGWGVPGKPYRISDV